jgi:hypothetical protein
LAIDLFNSAEFEQGVLVSKFDLGIVLYEKGDVDSSLLTLSELKRRWQELDEPFRVFVTNNYIIKCLLKQKASVDNIRSLYNENLSLFKTGQVTKLNSDFIKIKEELINLGIIEN